MFRSFLAVVLLSVHLVHSATTSGSFSLLSYNVAGLPEALSSGNPATNTPLISPKLAPYNIINVQEDFNYHAALYANDNHAYRTPTSGGAAIGSGMNTLSDFPFIDLDRIKWSDCNLSGGDCLTPKGFTFVRVRVAEGVWVDVYNLHTDAGSEDGDVNARSKNFAQVSSYISTWSAGFPVIVMGDTNSRYSRPVDSDSLRNFVASTGTTDLWVSKIRGGVPPASGTDALVCPFPFPVGTTQATKVACEVVDKFFIRGTAAVSFPSATYVNADDAFQDSNGAPLSDHYPASSTVSWKLSSSIRLGDPAGGPHGDAFNDVSSLLSGPSIPKLTSITIRGAKRIDGVSYTVSYGSTATSTTTTRGGTGGDPYTLTLAAGERVTQVYACQGKYNNTTRVFYLKLTTSTGRTLAVGTDTGDCTTSNVPSDASSSGNWGLVAFWGRSGNEIDRIAPIWGAA